ncbi:MAG: hypothetical protein ACHQ52_10750 [Candidatus Eisenbacteria bacterium]
MRRRSWPIPALVLAASILPATLPAAENRSRLADAPPPPAYALERSPEQSMVAGSQVYVVQDRRIADDEFRYGVFWYVYRAGWWYRARNWNGPFAAIEPRDVPRAIITVPPGRWKHLPVSAPELTSRPAPAWVVEKERRIHPVR